MCYKLNQIDEALEACKIETEVAEKDIQLIYMIKGKCFDKHKNYPLAVQQYTKGLEISTKLKLDPRIIATFKFRLGWSMIRTEDEQLKKQGTDLLS